MFPSRNVEFVPARRFRVGAPLSEFNTGTFNIWLAVFNHQRCIHVGWQHFQRWLNGVAKPQDTWSHYRNPIFIYSMHYSQFGEYYCKRVSGCSEVGEPEPWVDSNRSCEFRRPSARRKSLLIPTLSVSSILSYRAVNYRLNRRVSVYIDTWNAFEVNEPYMPFHGLKPPEYARIITVTVTTIVE